MDENEALPTGNKWDQGKPRMSLIDPAFLIELAEVLTFGAQKYGAHNWRGGIATSRLLDAALRHITSYNGGENTDPESGKSHLIHATACLMMALRFTDTSVDDRYCKS